jgi:RNA polymerase sigma-70 factor, ECF subfamily
MPVIFADDGQIVEALKRGDEEAFEHLAQRYHTMMVRLARGFARDDDTAEDIAQEAWLAVLNGIGKFERRGTLKSWIFSIVVNRAKTRATRDARVVPFSTLANDELSHQDPAVDPARFRGLDDQYPRGWLHPPAPWADDPEGRLTSAETLREVREAIEALPPAQRSVLVLRDVAGHEAVDICNILGISETNMRVLLHRGRSKVRAKLERTLTTT